ncbi:DUF397 domain-containing protein [Streptomyces sp. NPDC004752]
MIIISGSEPALDVVYVDFHTGSLLLEKDQELDRYRLAFEYLQAQATECLEAAFVPTGVAIRDSKDAHGPSLTLPGPAWHAFTWALRRGELVL